MDIIGSTNVYTINNKKLIPVLEFPNSEEARDYVRDQHRFNPVFVTLAHSMLSDERDRFLDLFSFYDDRYLLHRTYFTGDEEALEKKIKEAWRLG